MKVTIIDRDQSLSHEELFLEKYSRLINWALKITHYDRELAEDLVHESFVQFKVSKPDLNAINNLDGYLYGILRNLHLSHLRRTTRRRIEQLSTFEFDSAEDVLLAIDPRHLFKVHDELRAICQYACLRKESSVAGSVLILRFFHGYFASEVAEILQSSRNVVDFQLNAARREARIFLDDPSLLKFFNKISVSPSANNPATFSADILTELRRNIFETNDTECLLPTHLQAIYQFGEEKPTRADLCHMVACRICLDEANKLLGLMSLKKRHPIDFLGKERDMERDDMNDGDGSSPPPASIDNTKKNGTGKAKSAGNNVFRTGDPSAIDFQKLNRRVKRIFEHRPRELFISVNGFIQASQKIHSDLSEIKLDIDLTEPIDFIEVFSEQNVRLCMVNVFEQSDDSENCRLKVNLSDERWMDVTLRHAHPFPTVSLIYNDPLVSAEQKAYGEEFSYELISANRSEQSSAKKTETVSADTEIFPSLKVYDKKERLGSRLAMSIKNLTQRQFSFSYVTASAFAVLLFVGLMFFLLQPETPPDSATLLQRAIVAEEKLAAQTDRISHRVIEIEERLIISDQSEKTFANNSESLLHRRVEIWQNAERGLTVKRLFDEQNQLIGGDWQRARDNVRTIYDKGKASRLELLSRNQSALFDVEKVWLADLSAKTIADLNLAESGMNVETGSDSYFLTYNEPHREETRSAANPDSPRVIRATLRFDRFEMRLIAQTFVIASNNEQREYRFTETKFEQLSPKQVAPTVFEPDPELFGNLLDSDAQPKAESVIKGKNDTETGEASVETQTSLAVSVEQSSITASPELEVEVLQLLHDAGADMGEQITVMRARNGKLHIEGIVDTEQRREELRKALKPILNNEAVEINLNTGTEAAKRQTNKRRTVEITEQPTDETTEAANESDLQEYFSRQGLSGEKLNAAVRAYSSNTIRRSRRILQHAYALKNLAGKFNHEAQRKLSPEAKVKWLSLIRNHAASLHSENENLKRELKQIFSAPTTFGESKISDEREIAQTVENLLRACLANDRVIGTAFAISNKSGNSNGVKNTSFWISLSKVEHLSAAVSNIRN